MTQWLQAARAAEAALAAPHPTPEPVVSVVSVLSEGETPRPPTSTRDPDAPHGRSVTGTPLTWTGRVVSLDEWRALSDWDRHGPNGRVWSGITRQWEDPT